MRRCLWRLPFLTACTSYMQTPTFSGPPGPDEAKVVFCRPSRLFGAGAQFPLWDGEKFLGYSDSGCTVEYRCAPGELWFVAVAQSYKAMPPPSPPAAPTTCGSRRAWGCGPAPWGSRRCARRHRAARGRAGVVAGHRVPRAGPRGVRGVRGQAPRAHARRDREVPFRRVHAGARAARRGRTPPRASSPGSSARCGVTHGRHCVRAQRRRVRHSRAP
jgi:hypothetical protein